MVAAWRACYSYTVIHKLHMQGSHMVLLVYMQSHQSQVFENTWVASHLGPWDPLGP